MADGTSYGIDLGVQGAAGVQTAASQLDALADRLERAGAASQLAAGAVKEGEAVYKRAATAADNAAKAVERIGLKADEQRGKLKKAMEAGDERAFWRAAGAIENLNARHAEAVTQAASAKSALDAAAVSLDGLRTASDAAVSAQAELSRSISETKSQSDAMTKTMDAIRASEAAVAKAFIDRSKASIKAGKDEQAARIKTMDTIRSLEKASLDSFLRKSNAEVKANKAAADARAKVDSVANGSGKVNEMAEAFGKLGGPLGRLGSTAFGTAEGFKKLLGSLGAVGVYAAVAIAIAAIASAAVIATGAILKFAVANSEAARTSAMLSAGIAKSVVGGAALDDAIEGLSKRVPQSREELQGMAADLAKTGLQGKALTDALDAAATKAAEAKWGPEWRTQMTSLDKLSQLFKAHLGDIFKLNIGPLLDQFGKIVGLFDATSITGRAMKVVFQDVFQRLLDALTELGPKIVRTFIQFEIWALKALIAIKPFGSTIVTVAEVFGVAALVIAGAAAVLIGLFVAVGAAMAAGLAYVLAGSQLFYGLGQSIREGAVGALDSLKASFDAVVAFLKGLSLADIGNALIEGLIAGITGAGPALLSAVSGLAGGAIGAAVSVLKIGSPSKVFEDIGQNTGEGMTIGVERSAPDVQDAVTSMVAPPAGQASATPTAATAGGSLPPIVVNAYANTKEDAESVAAVVRREVVAVLESFAAIGGGATANA